MLVYFVTGVLTFRTAGRRDAQRVLLENEAVSRGFIPVTRHGNLPGCANLIVTLATGAARPSFTFSYYTLDVQAAQDAVSDLAQRFGADEESSWSVGAENMESQPPRETPAL